LPARQTALVLERREALTEALRAAGFADVAVPDRGDNVTI
jgi:hypothetical protein